ncbi:MAG: sugar phosphate isomerase/epimerase, partial [Promethearchaeota archaeon]
LLDFIKFAKLFDEVDLDFKKIKKLLSKNSQLNDLIEILDIYDTKIASIYPLEDFSLCSDRDYKTTILKNFQLMLEYSIKLESNLIVVNPSILNTSIDINSIPKWRIINRTTKRLQEISKRAYKEDINVGFEFSTQKGSSITTLKEAKEVLKPLESQENLGYIIDTFHIGILKLDFNEIKEILNFIYLIKLADFNDNSPENQKRLFPGQGSFDFNKFYRFLEKLSYNKTFSIELSQYKCSETLLEKFSAIFKKV